jgi:hypothetical protein
MVGKAKTHMISGCFPKRTPDIGIDLAPAHRSGLLLLILFDPFPQALLLTPIDLLPGEISAYGDDADQDSHLAPRYWSVYVVRGPNSDPGHDD